MGIVYVLLGSNGRYYVGSTNNLEKRLEKHHGGYSKATKGMRPLTLVGYRTHESLIEARREEIYLKRMKSKKVIEKFIERNKLGG